MAEIRAALLAFVEAVEQDATGVWIDHVEDEDVVIISLIGNCQLPSLGEAYVTACLALGRPIVGYATTGGIGTRLSDDEIHHLIQLPRGG